ncbi:RPP1 [Sanghuangporus vaninii]
MYSDLNVPVPIPASLPQKQGQASKKNKGKQPATQVQQPRVVFSAAQLARLEARIDLLVRLGYTVVAFNQTVLSKVDPSNHVNVLDPLLSQLRKREGTLYLKRLTIELDEDSEKGNGLSTGNVSLFTSYDILALKPTTQTNLSSACLTHTQPSSLTTHIISIPLTEPRLPFRLKHTLVRTAIKNGAVFEINYFGALLAGGAGEGGGDEERRNWWAAARELVRVTKGKGLIVSSGVDNDQLLRAPRDVGNLIALLGIAQNLAHDAATLTPKSLLLRSQTRKTYRAILSEPTLIMPDRQTPRTALEASGSPASTSLSINTEARDVSQDANDKALEKNGITPAETPKKSDTGAEKTNRTRSNGKKRTIGDMDENVATASAANGEVPPNDVVDKKKKKQRRAKAVESGAS